MPIRDDGEFVNPAWNRARVEERSIDEFIGLVKGIVADGMVTASEAVALQYWCQGNAGLVSRWPFREIMDILAAVGVDPKVNAVVLGDLLQLLEKAVGSQAQADMPTKDGNPVSNLPLTVPAPPVVFTDQVFVFTGKFDFGPRSKCQLEAEKRGARCASVVSGSVSYLVIGQSGNPDWIHSSWGRKIEHAMELREGGSPVKIISEENFVSALAILSPEAAKAQPPVEPDDVRVAGISFHEPDPLVELEGTSFYFFGKTFCGLNRFEDEIRRRGGKLKTVLRADVNYFTVGARTPRDIATTNYSFQIERAHNFSQSHGLKIITERWLHRALFSR